MFELLPTLLPSAGFGEQRLAETPILRQNGIDDKIEGFGSLLLEH